MAEWELVLFSNSSGWGLRIATRPTLNKSVCLCTEFLQQYKLDRSTRTRLGCTIRDE